MPGATSATSPAEAYFEAASQRFRDLAASAGTTVSRQISLAGRAVRIEVSAGAMEQAIMPALAHLADAEAREPDLVLSAWDSESTGAPPMSPAWGAADYRRQGHVSGFNDRRFHTAAQFDPTILRMLDMEERHALCWTPSAARLPYWEIAAPLRPLLHEWLRRSGLVALHGAAVGEADGGVLVAGAGGRGKSNVALACLNSELLYAADDFCVLSRAPAWTVHSVYCTGRIAAGDRERHPHLRGAECNPDRLDREKALFFLNRRFGGRLIREMPLRAIVLPRVIAQGSSEIVPIPAAAAQKTMALSAIELSQWTGRDTLMKVAELLRAVPCYELRVGASIGEVPVALAALLSVLREKRSPSARA